MKYHVSSVRCQVILFFVISFLFSGLLGCEKLNNLLNPKKEEAKKVIPTVTVKGTIIAKVNNIPVTLEDLTQEIAAYNEAMEAQERPEAKITTRDQKTAYLKDTMVRRALLYQEALDRGLDSKEEVIQVLEKTKQDLLVMELVRQEAEKIEVASKEIEDYYNNSKKVGRTLLYEIMEPEERQIREIVVPNENEAREILIQLLQGADFANIARERSKSPTAREGGDLGFISPGKKFPQFDTVAFSGAIDIGKVSSIFKGPDGYYIIKLDAKRGGKEKSLTDMWDKIKGELTYLKQQKKIDELIEKLSREVKLEIFEGKID